MVHCALAAFCAISLSAQRIATTSATKDRIFPKWVTFNPGVSAPQLVAVLKNELRWPHACGLEPKGKPVNDELGFSHQRFQQLYNGIPVFGATVAVHAKGGALTAMNGELIAPSVQAYGNARRTNPQAIEAAMRFVDARTYMWESPKMEAFIRREQRDSAATFKPVPQLVYYPVEFPKLSGKLRLAYLIDVYAMDPRSRQWVLVDATTGEAFKSFDQIHSIDEPGTAQTAYSGIQAITTFRPSTSSPYELRDFTRGQGIITYDCANTDNYDGAQVPVNTNNNWNLGSIYANSILDAHWGTEQTYDYYLNEHNWNSYDNNGSPLLSYAHFNLVAYGYPNNNNAFWDGSRMTYGDGNGTTFNPLTAIDVLGHEITHGVTEHSAGLVYDQEAGALNESFSDIIGSCIERRAKPGGFSWLLGNDMSMTGTGFRNLANPNQFGDPDTYQGDYWYTGDLDHGGVHTNSGVQNFWFYLLVEGGAGTNDAGNTYNVQGIGMQHAGAIVFRSLTAYLNANAQYADARDASIQAATDLFGGCSAELAAVTNAWYAVGVGNPFSNAVVAAFTSSSNYFCMAPASVQFTNGSLNASGYAWEFGDGTTSLAASPQHTYSAPGSYTVRLVANGSTFCNSSDTLIAAFPIVVDNTGALVPASCTPAPTNPTANAGIFNFSFAGINKASTGATDGYQDFSCEHVTDVTEGLSYPLSVGLHIPGYLGFWIDLDNDGTFTSNERLYASSGESVVHAANVIIPAGTVFQTRLRARAIASDQPITSACATGSGQAEDYSVRIVAGNNPPVAAFTALPLVLLAGTATTFHDLSLHAPTQWEWSFDGGNITSSGLQNPQVSYDAIGEYDVKLIVSNAHGSDTLLMPGFIHVVDAFNLCQVAGATAATGTFYDTGGPNGNYSNNETCTLLIAPACAASITVSFQAFSTENNWDFLRFYDGNSDAAPLLGAFTGSSIPAPFTTSGGQLFVKWTSDQGVTGAGFRVDWTSQIGSSEPLVAVASADALTPALGQTVQFTDLSMESPFAWNWDFGDGTSSTAQNPGHTYVASGPKTVVFTATNCNGSDADTLHINVQQPGAMEGIPVLLELNGSPCTDTVTTHFTLRNTGAGTLNWAITSPFSDGFEGSSINTALWASSTGYNASECGAQQGAKAHRFSSNGTRAIRTRPLPVQAGSRLSFYLRYGTGGSCEPPENGEYVVLEYSLDGAAWNAMAAWPNLGAFSDWGLVDVAMPQAAYSDHTSLRLRQIANNGTDYDVWALDEVTFIAGYSGNLVLNPTVGTIASNDSTRVDVALATEAWPPGTYSDTLVVSSNDPNMLLVRIPISITIANLPCAAFSVNYTDSCQGRLQFINTTVNDAGVWQWDFGDGTSATEQAPMHTYASSGDFTVTLIAGTPPLTTQYSSVVHANPITAQLVHSNPDAGNGTTTFSAGSPTAVQWLWDFGDGGTSVLQATTHTYLANGSYVVRLTVWNEVGCSIMVVDTLQYGLVGIAEMDAAEVQLFPNPSNGLLTVRIAAPAHARLTDATGRAVPGTWALQSGDNTIDIRAIADGTYVLQLRYGDEVRHVRIMKQ